MAENFAHGSYFNEFTLMTIASIGAFFIGEYPEGVAVMLFYTIGELLQDNAVHNARRHIGTLLDGRPPKITIITEQGCKVIAPEEVQIGDIAELKVGEKIAVDGVLLDQEAVCDTSALTGESLPREMKQNDELLSGMILIGRPARIRITRLYADSTLAKILSLVEEASARKAPAELIIRKLARYYTPAVAILAMLIYLIPLIYSFIYPNYIFHSSEHLYRSLVFLVISCPCALVISIPLGYFGGIGAASRQGILIKGGNCLDLLLNTDTFVFDKTGTLTNGRMMVTHVETIGGYSPERLLQLASSIEQHSLHPIGLAITQHTAHKGISLLPTTDIAETAGRGMRGIADQEHILVGNRQYMAEAGITCPESSDYETTTLVFCAINHRLAGIISLDDTIKTDAPNTIAKLRERYRLQILSGDRQPAVQHVAQTLRIDEAYGDLLPRQKVAHLDQLIDNGTHTVTFVGDGINDGPALALAHLGIAMGGLGSDAAIEAADIVIQNDNPSKILTAIRIARTTRTIVWQNILFALGIKIVILLLGAFGMASLWAAVFADVGVAMLAILNAMRILWKKI